MGFKWSRFKVFGSLGPRSSSALVPAKPRIYHGGLLRPHVLLLMVEILHYLKDPKLWELWYTPYYR